MKTYRLITGFYPSRNTAEKILNKAKGNCKDARIESVGGFFTVVLAESMDYEEINRKFDEYISKKLYCGIIFSYDL